MREAAEQSKKLTRFAAGAASQLIAAVSLLEDHNQKRLFPTTMGEGATAVELPHQLAEPRRQNKSLKFAGLASDWTNQSCQGFTNTCRQGL